MALARKPIEIVEEGKHQLLVKAPHWERIFLHEVARVQNGFAFSSTYFSKSEGLPLIRIRDIDKETTVDRYSGEFSDEYIVKQGDILIGMDGDFKVARWKGEEALLNQRVCRVIPTSSEYDERFLLLCIQPFLDAIHSETSSVTVKHLSSRTIEEIPLPYPPLVEQHAIVTKIEEIFSELDHGVEQLKTAQQQLKVYRQAVLKWAFEGRLTNAEVRNGELPEGWKWVRLGEVCKVQVGFAFKSANFRKEGIRLLRGENIEPGSLRWTNTVFWDPADINVYKDLLIDEGDVILAMDRPVISSGLKVAEAKKRDLPSLLVQRVARIKSENPRFIFFSINNQRFITHCLGNQTGTQLPHISGKQIENFEFPLPPLPEQHQIVAEIERRLSVCDKLEEAIVESLKAAEVLRAGVLKRAFEGKLV